MKLLRFIVCIFVLLSCFECTNRDERKLQFTVNSRLGDTPLMYIQEKGWLQDLPVEFVFVTSLGQSLELYRQGLSHGFAGTQYEASISRDPNIRAAILLDRSNGQDKVLSNVTLEQLKQASKPIDVYLEKNSVNTPVFEAFIKTKGLKHKEFLIHDTMPSSQLMLPLEKMPMLLVSYDPFSSQLEERGFHVLVSDRDLSLLVINALFVNEEAYTKYHKTLVELKRLCEQALTQLESQPREFYETVEKHLEGLSFAEFNQSPENIEWLVKEVPGPVKQLMQGHNIPTDKIIQ